MNIILPEKVKYIIDRLEESGHEAFIVGGCVRDSMLGKTPFDWDICTDALPDRIIEIFKDRRVIETGLKHGTVTVLSDGDSYEVTTYRSDGVYSDNRRPDAVEFINDLKGDLIRRDFTINAMAYNPAIGLIDHFGGRNDLKNGIIKCVGNANERVREDALRIMRALRFASQLGFQIEKDTAAAMHENKRLLNNISSERIAAELNKFLIGDNVRELIGSHISIITELIPETIPMIGFEQNNPYHCYDVFEHSLYSIEQAPKDSIIRLTMFFHDIAKPACYTQDGNGIGHFHGHPQMSSDMARTILKRLKYDNDTIETITQLIIYHDTELQSDTKQVKRFLNRLGEERFRQLLVVKKADTMAHAAKRREHNLATIEKTGFILDEIIEQDQCFSIKNLSINGNDLVAAGITEGVMIGRILHILVDMVIDEKIKNEKAALLLKSELLMNELLTHKIL